MPLWNGPNDYTGAEEAVRRFGRQYSKTVSIVVPFYRGLDLLANALAGIQVQTYPRELIELVVAEDGDAGEAKELIAEMNKHIPTKLTQHPRNGYRLSTTRNEGILAAQGEVIVLLDFDMIPLPALVESHARWFHVSEIVSTIGLRKFISAIGIEPTDVIADIGRLCRLPDTPSSSNRFQEKDNRIDQLIDFKHHPFPFNCFHGCNVAFLRRHAIEIGLFDESFNGFCGYDDIEFGLRLWEHGNYLVYEPGALGLHQENEVVTFRKRDDDRERNLGLLYEKSPSGYREFRRAVGKDL